ncbi:minor capsid protein [Fructilactobacillus florum]|uniref:Phage head morphogenesis domain-containing protein n=1 Tax=Fructilactobacillus florum DSM 22689 = JCM 16035 TaxID=1423745 RepID=A0A0R2CJC7_9LACO|nr:minor capsid protein [Fructilactobacillus florum]KRM91591.1 hypothetical protein FC87_GL000723 [Fructilactobacillus florum DSM 22689 = JCM 16035]
MDTDDFDEALDNHAQSAIGKGQQELYSSLQSGMSEDDLKQLTDVTSASDDRQSGNISSAINTEVSQTQTLLRTEASSANNDGATDAMKENDVEYVHLLTEGDEKVCDICDSYWDSNPFEIDDAPNIPDDTHPNCRCQLIPCDADDTLLGTIGNNDDSGDDGSSTDNDDPDNDNPDGSGDDGSDDTLQDKYDTYQDYQRDYQAPFDETDKDAMGDYIESNYGIEWKEKKRAHYKISPETMANTVRVLDRFFSYYPNFLDNGQYKFTSLESHVFTGSSARAEAYVQSLRWRDGRKEQSLHLNSKHGDLEAQQKMTDYSFQTNWFRGNDTSTHIPTHEFGHAVDNNLTAASGSDVRVSEQILTQMYREDRGDHYDSSDFQHNEDFKHWAFDNIGTYGSKSTAEGFAELFTEYYGCDNPRPVAVRFGKIIDNMLREM